jgi:hypothetical protein
MQYLKPTIPRGPNPTFKRFPDNPMIQAVEQQRAFL